MVDNKVDIVVLTWNKLETTKAFFESLVACTRVRSRVIVIDNASTDETPGYLKTLQDNENLTFEVITNSENIGYLKGANQGIALTSAPFVCLANNDLTFTTGWLEGLLRVMESDEEIGLLNPNSNNLGCRKPADVTLESLAEVLREKDRDTFIEMPFCIGFCMLARREVLQEVGGFSEEYAPMFFEDSDLTLKAHQAGFLTGMAKGVYVYHEEHSSINQIDLSEREAIMAKSRDTFHQKWGDILRIAFVVPTPEKRGKALHDAISLAREGNFVWLFMKNFNESRESFFEVFECREHSGVHLMSYANQFHLLWLLLKKKKRYHLVYCQFPFVRSVLSLLKFQVREKVDVVNIQTEKRRSEAVTA